MKHLLAFLLLTATAQCAIIEFVQNGCPPCEQMRPIVQSLRQSGWSIDEVNISNTPDARCQGGTPQWVVTDESGKVTSRKIGLCSNGDLLSFLVQATDKEPQRSFSVSGPIGTGREYLVKCEEAAEASRLKISDDWFGEEVRWPQTALIKIRQFDNSHGGGATSFGFNDGRCVGPFTATLVGTHENIIRDVIPHEVHHMVFAEYFGRKIPRWADEGSAIIEETSVQKRLQWDKLIDGLRRGTAWPMTQLLAATEYSSDMEKTLMLYAQGWSLVDFLIQHEGKRHFAHFLGSVMSSGDYPQEFEKFYRFSDLGQLQGDWLTWVKQGAPRSQEIHTTNFRGCRWDCRLGRWVPVEPPLVPVNPPVAQRPQARPSIPNALPVQPKACQCDHAKLKAEILAEIRADESLRGPAGKDGRDGKDGERGPAGADGKDAIVDVDVLAEKVGKRLPPRPVYFEIKPRKR